LARYYFDNDIDSAARKVRGGINWILKKRFCCVVLCCVVCTRVYTHTRLL
jgi:hypothetical protein